jgi:hypothetical protein
MVVAAVWVPNLEQYFAYFRVTSSIALQCEELNLPCSQQKGFPVLHSVVQLLETVDSSVGLGIKEKVDWVDWESLEVVVCAELNYSR